MMYDPEDYVRVDECARRMNITEAEVMDPSLNVRSRPGAMQHH
jgi:hypothetical protein